MATVGIETVHQAAKRIAPFAHATPVLSSQYFNDRFGAKLHFKCENFQKIGAFKFRGACNTVLSLPVSEAQHGVVTHSSGNHAQAVALAAKLRHIPATVVMPRTAARIKRVAVEGYGASVVMCEPTLHARESTASDIQQRQGSTLVHPYDDPRIIAGQATAALELVEQAGPLDVVMAPVGGGGLLSGTAITIAALCPKAQVIGVEPKGADDAWQSLQAGKIIPSVNPVTIADGLLTSLGAHTFPIIQRLVNRIVTVSESAIVEALRMTWERMKILIEPSSAVPMAALIENQIEVTGKRVGIILSGGNVDLDNLPWVGSGEGEEAKSEERRAKGE